MQKIYMLILKMSNLKVPSSNSSSFTNVLIGLIIGALAMFIYLRFFKNITKYFFSDTSEEKIEPFTTATSNLEPPKNSNVANLVHPNDLPKVPNTFENGLDSAEKDESDYDSEEDEK